MINTLTDEEYTLVNFHLIQIQVKRRLEENRQDIALRNILIGSKLGRLMNLSLDERLTKRRKLDNTPLVSKFSEKQLLEAKKGYK